MATIGLTSVVVLAAGLSRRYGASNKLLADFNGKPLALHIAETLADLPFHQRIAVCPVEDGQLRALFLDRGFEIALNSDPTRGQASSLAVGVAAAAKTGPDAILICLADMPLVSATLVTKLIEMLDTDPIGIVASASLSERLAGPPAIFAPAHFQSLMSLEGDVGARVMLRAAPTMLVPDECLLDLDSCDDFIARSAKAIRQS
jgi:molybdenum cofactor cytidylyltransferase